jgi:hypothetical protein
MFVRSRFEAIQEIQFLGKRSAGKGFARRKIALDDRKNGAAALG